MSPKPRTKENRGLPKGWRFKHGAYHFRVPKGLEHLWDGKGEYKLGRTLSAAHKTFSERIGNHDSITTMAELLDRYAAEIVPGKAAATQRNNLISIRRLRSAFDANHVSAIRPVHIYKYMDAITQNNGATSANHDHEVLSHAFTRAIRWGIIDVHPMTNKKVVKNSTSPRSRLPEDWEIAEVLKVAPPLIKAYLQIKLLTGISKGDILSIKKADVGADGILVTRNKTGKTTLYEWTPELKRAIADARALRNKILSPYLFSTGVGQPYIKADRTTSGFDSAWQRCMKKALAETDLVEKFTEHDLRAYVASKTSLEHARALLQHSSAATTERNYRRGAERVKPIRSKK